ncbi:MAG: 3-deoxy-D-manno-octulosonate 8-phosphate phosphatase [Epsilonproteobacteria bacterium]|nr:MAG: 3-deoxy-D-manno-octulosonate 8-phosphate phosphatase [Campylobacterota bacterium]
MIELIILDVDGTLTDGKIIYTSSGDELKNFDVKDGLAIASWIKKLNKKIAIVTGRKSKLVERRAKELGITHIYQGFDNKDEIIQNILKEENLTWENVAAIGDDLNDYKMLKKVQLSFAVANAVEDIKTVANVVCNKNGGDGAVREMIEYILKYENQKGLKELWA